MFPGMNPKAVKQAMKKMGIKQENIDAHEVIIKTSDKNIIIRNPSVQKVNMMGEDSFQISGQVSEESPINEDDINTVMEQASCSKEKALEALEKSNGDLAEAIMSLQE
tara:strand:- start:75 stop:398 length:324 start_codon:yes stop_codon:yes gene_type:complete